QQITVPQVQDGFKSRPTWHWPHIPFANYGHPHEAGFSPGSFVSLFTDPASATSYCELSSAPGALGGAPAGLPSEQALGVRERGSRGVRPRALTVWRSRRSPLNKRAFGSLGS